MPASEFSRAATAELAVAAVHEALPLRQCTQRLSPRRPSSACVLAEMRRCGAPCLGPGAGESVEAYAAHAAAYRTAVQADPAAVVEGHVQHPVPVDGGDLLAGGEVVAGLPRPRRRVSPCRGSLGTRHRGTLPFFAYTINMILFFPPLVNTNFS